MDNIGEADRKRFEHDKRYRMSRPAGERFQLSSMTAASGLILTDDEPKEEQHSPLCQPLRGSASFRNSLTEAKTSLKGPSTTQETTREERPAAEFAIGQPIADRPMRRDERLTQNVTYGLLNESAEELQARENGIRGARKRRETALSLCTRKHIRLVCHWHHSDPINTNGTWRLERRDYRGDPACFDNGVEEHTECSQMKRSELLRRLAQRMIDDYEYNEGILTFEMSKELRRRNLQSLGQETRRSPSLARVIRELGKLLVHLRGREDISRKKEKVEARVERYRKLMEAQAQAKITDQKRIRRRTAEQRQSQRMINSMSILNDLFHRTTPSDLTENSQPTIRRRGIMPEDNSKVSQLQTKRELAVAHADHRGKSKSINRLGTTEDKKDKGEILLTEAELKTLHNVNTAQLEEAAMLDQDEKDDEERLLQLTAERAEAGQTESGEEETETAYVGLANATKEATGNTTPEHEIVRKKPTNPRKETVGSKRPTTDTLTEGSDNLQASSPPFKKQKKAPEESTSPKSSDQPNIFEPSKADKRVSKKIPKPKVGLQDPLIAKATVEAGKAKGEDREKGQTEKTKETFTKGVISKETTSVADATEKGPGMTKSGKAHKSEELIVDSDLEDEAKGVTDLL